MTLDPRLNAFRDDLADVRLRGKFTAARYVEGQPAWAIAGRAAVRANRRPEAEVVTYYHYGEGLRVFEMVDNIAWCQSLFDGYVGYVATSDIALGEVPMATHFVAPPGAYAYEQPDLRSKVVGCLPRHSAVVVVESGLVSRGTQYAQLDTASYLPAACLAAAPPRSAGLVAAADLYLGCPYLWGGRSFFGIDCSGLVQSAFRDLGVTVPRDTDMQRDAIGEAVALAGPDDPVGDHLALECIVAPAEAGGQGNSTPLAPDSRLRGNDEKGADDALKRGDLLYLPGHVMIYAGAGAVIHADGATMTVRRDNLAALMQARGLGWRNFTIRRHPLAAGGG